MKKLDVVKAILTEIRSPVLEKASAFAPSNIALCKYWGKRNTELNLPLTNSLSISLGEKGANVIVEVNDRDEIIVNNIEISLEDKFSQRLLNYINLFRPPNLFLKFTIISNIPIAAGLASSACGFASIILALNKLFNWKLTNKQLSILARLGSGSAARSIEHGFLEWHKGEAEHGLDSYGERLSFSWPQLCVGLLIVNKDTKKISSREAMLATVNTSQLYASWPEQVAADLFAIKEALAQKDFNLLGASAEKNAEAMHATMFHAVPPISYSTDETIKAKQQVWDLRSHGLPLYFTQDAGPNLKLLFLENEIESVKKHFPHVEIIQPLVSMQ